MTARALLPHPLAPDDSTTCRLAADPVAYVIPDEADLYLLPDMSWPGLGGPVHHPVIPYAVARRFGGQISLPGVRFAHATAIFAADLAGFLHTARFRACAGDLPGTIADLAQALTIELEALGTRRYTDDAIRALLVLE